MTYTEEEAEALLKVLGYSVELIDSPKADWVWRVVVCDVSGRRVSGGRTIAEALDSTRRWVLMEGLEL